MNIHSNKGFAKGKQAPLKRDSVPFGKFLTTIPLVPLTDLAPAYNYPMDGNDAVGDCVVAGWDHFRQTVTGLLAGTGKNFTQDEIWAFYKTQNPNFDPNSATNGAGSSSDNGMNIQLFLEYLVAQKYILGFASVDWKNEPELRAAIYIGLGVMTGVQLQNAQMNQFNSGVWDYDPNSSIDGGHCIPLNGYKSTPDKFTCVTWAHLIDCTLPFITNQMDECWFVLMQEHVDHPGFRNHFDLQGFSDAVKAITNGKVVIPVPSPIEPTITIGSTGQAVINLQTKLVKLGYLVMPPGVPMGYFGRLTLAAVKKFQSDHCLPAEGICGPLTWQAFDMIDIITAVCTQNGIEPLLGIAIASCESSLNPKNTLYNPGSNSTDRGLYQWNSLYHKEITDAMAFDPKEACQLFCNAVKAGKLKTFWSASEHCWKPKLTPAIIAKYQLY